MNNPSFALIGDHNHDSEMARSVTVRLSETLHAYLSAMAIDNERSLSEELRAALEIHADLHRLSLILDQQTQRARKEASGGVFGTVHAAPARVSALRSDIAERWARSFPAAHQVFQRRFPEFLWNEKV